MTDPVVAYFEANAGAYDRQTALEWPALRTAARLAGPLAGRRVVDLAAGTGASAAALARGRPARLTLVDASPAMLARARRRLAGVPAAEFVLADARDTPLPPASADVVVAAYLLHLLEPEDRAAVLAEARRILTPGGRLVVVVHGVPPGVAGRAYTRVARLLRPAGAVGGGPMPGLRSVLAANGFDVARVVGVPGPYWSQVAVARPRITPRRTTRTPGADAA